MAIKRPFIVEIHLQIQAAFWSEAQQQLETTLKDRPLEKYKISPLYLTHDAEDTEIRLCLQFKDPVLLERFIVEEIHKRVLGILGTRVRLTLNGEVFENGVAKLMSGEPSIKSCHVFLSVESSMSEAVWESLSGLTEACGVCPAWLFRDFYEFNRDITVRLVGESEEALRRYVDQHISKIAGIRIWRLQFIKATTQIASKEHLMGLASSWFDVKRTLLRAK